MKRLIPHLAAVTVILACAWLAQWQVERADDKRELLARWHDREAVQLGALLAPYELPAPVVSGVGKWGRDRQILVDNQVRNGRTGVHVLTPWIEPDGRMFLVNRGWAEWPARTAPLPDPGVGHPTATIRGVLNRGPGVGSRLGGIEIPPDPDWPLLVTYFDAAGLADVYGPALEAPVIQLEPGHPAHLTGDPWQVVTFGPDRHIGYAMTWTTIAAVVALIWLVLSVRAFRTRQG